MLGGDVVPPPNVLPWVPISNIQRTKSCVLTIFVLLAHVFCPVPPLQPHASQALPCHHITTQPWSCTARHSRTHHGVCGNYAFLQQHVCVWHTARLPLGHYVVGLTLGDVPQDISQHAPPAAHAGPRAAHAARTPGTMQYAGSFTTPLGLPNHAKHVRWQLRRDLKGGSGRRIRRKSSRTCRGPRGLQLFWHAGRSSAWLLRSAWLLKSNSNQ